jgi:flagellar biogenesis protein FliO
VLYLKKVIIGGKMRDTKEIKNSFDKHFDRVFNALVAFQIIGALFGLGFLGFVIWIVLHFVFKFW